MFSVVDSGNKEDVIHGCFSANLVLLDWNHPLHIADPCVVWRSSAACKEQSQKGAAKVGMSGNSG
jgi:hypothetical protein